MRILFDAQLALPGGECLGLHKSPLHKASQPR
jgi:hypothetical protein